MLNSHQHIKRVTPQTQRALPLTGDAKLHWKNCSALSTYKADENYLEKDKPE